VHLITISPTSSVYPSGRSSAVPAGLAVHERGELAGPLIPNSLLDKRVRDLI
jgi:hypothetical protein